MIGLDDPIFRKYLAETAGDDRVPVVLDALSGQSAVSVRLNPFKGVRRDHFDNVSEDVPWSPHGFFLSERPDFTLDPLFHAGGYYVQDSSAMFPGYAFREALKGFSGLSRPVRILDLCAAPGGKTTDIAASAREVLSDNFVLVANEVMRARSGILADNVAMWGDPCVVVTNSDPKAFACLEGFFDIIVADVPCSGEGMFRKDPEALRQWSEDNVALCSARQRRIVSDVWPSLAEGGVLVYSTCTFNALENDGNALWIENNLGAEVCLLDCPWPEVIKTAEGGFSLMPGFVKGEGQYCISLRKTSSQESFSQSQSARKASKVSKSKGKSAGASAKHSGSGVDLKGLFTLDVQIALKGSTYIAIPSVIASECEVLAALRPIATGTAIGEIKGSDLVPHGDLALSQILAVEAFPRVNVTEDVALAYLHKDSIRLENAPKGLVLICCGGLPLGFAKNLGNRCNNLFPNGRRILKNITNS